MYNTPLRLLSPPRYQGALFCFREHGGQSISPHQGQKRPSSCRRPRGLHIPTNRLRPPPYTCFWLFSQRHETRKCSRHHDRSLRIPLLIPSRTTNRTHREGCRSHHQTGRFWPRTRDCEPSPLHRVCFYQVVSRPGSLAPEQRLF